MKASIALALSGASAFGVSRLIRAYRAADEAATARLASVERHFVDTSFGDVDHGVPGTANTPPNHKEHATETDSAPHGHIECLSTVRARRCVATVASGNP